MPYRYHMLDQTDDQDLCYIHNPELDNIEKASCVLVCAVCLARRRLVTDAQRAVSDGVECSTGTAYQYVDMHKAFQDGRQFWSMFFRKEMEGYWPVAVGKSGAYILGLTGQAGTLLRNQSSTYGLEWSGTYPDKDSEIILIDDCKFTGSTLKYAREWCEKSNLFVFKEVVGYTNGEFDVLSGRDEV